MSKLEVSIKKGLASAGWYLAADVVVELAESLESGYVIIPKADLPEVRRSASNPDSYRTEGESVVFTSTENARMWTMRDIAVWQFIAAENATRDKRRDELAAELAPRPGDLGSNWYGNVSRGLQNAIDRIIELEATK